MEASTRLILASGSPRRRELLSRAGLAFETIASDIDEVRAPGENVRDFAMRMAREKTLAVARRAPGALVLGADTMVECAGEILAKPVDAADAARMLRLLSNRTHTVVTAIALVRGETVLAHEAVESRVTFRRLSEDEISSYVAGSEPMDKAGAYGIQGVGGEFITRVEGPRDNVMGLPVNAVLAALRRANFVC